MKKRFSKSLLFFLSILFILSTVGCSFTKKTEQAAKSPSIAYDANLSEAEFGRSDKANIELLFNESAGDDQTALVGTGESSQAINNVILSQRKIIRNANISIEVDDFDVAYSKIEYIISNLGYVQESKINKVKHFVDNKIELVTSGVIIIRVDADKFNSVLKDIKGLGQLIDENIKTDDVTEKFFDVESRLRLLKYEESRLEEYLKKIDDPDNIFKTQRRLTDIRHEIEQLTGTLNKLSDLVKLSTITINMKEKAPTSTSEPSKQSYISQLKDNFLDSLNGVMKFLGNLLLVIVGSLPVLVLLGIVFFPFYFLGKKFLKKRKTKKESVKEEIDENSSKDE